MKIWDVEEWSYYSKQMNEKQMVCYISKSSNELVCNNGVGKVTPGLHLMENRTFLQNFNIILV